MAENLEATEGVNSSTTSAPVALPTAPPCTRRVATPTRSTRT